jgi:hypothetical protein
MANGNGLAYRPPAGEFVREVRQNDDVLRWRMSGARIRLTFGLAISANRICLISSPGESMLLCLRLLLPGPSFGSRQRDVHRQFLCH